MPAKYLRKGKENVSSLSIGLNPTKFTTFLSKFISSSRWLYWIIDFQRRNNIAKN